MWCFVNTSQPCCVLAYYLRGCSERSTRQAFVQKIHHHCVTQFVQLWSHVHWCAWHTANALIKSNEAMASLSDNDLPISCRSWQTKSTGSSSASGEEGDSVWTFCGTVEFSQQLGRKSRWMAVSHEESPMAALCRHVPSRWQLWFNLQRVISLMGGDFWLGSNSQEIKWWALYSSQPPVGALTLKFCLFGGNLRQCLDHRCLQKRLIAHGIWLWCIQNDLPISLCRFCMWSISMSIN